MSIDSKNSCSTLPKDQTTSENSDAKPAKVMTYESSESGFCRKYYKDELNRVYCLQLVTSRTASWYFCGNSIGEPEHPVDGTNWVDRDGNTIEYGRDVKTIYARF